MRKVLIFVLTLLIPDLIAQNADAGSDTVVMAEIFPASYTLNASGSTSESPIVNYFWVYQNDTLGNDISLEVSLVENQNRFTLIIEDELGNTDSDAVNIFLGHSTNYNKNRLPLRGNTLPRFISGMNIAWKDYSNDLNEFTPEDREYYQEIFDSISVNGGNAVRWWLHTNGANTPQINEYGFVEGIDLETIQGMKQVLDMAYDNGIVISMCLWSFDMLQNQNQDRNALNLLLTNTDNIQSYIDNALIPVLELIGDHPAVMTWEIFNEPEGMTTKYGWTPERVTMVDIQRFVNMCAGAIHRNTSQALVSNGSWNIKASSDVDGFKNYYTKENLIAIGGDQDGYMDFYQVHYYPKNHPVDQSPFHRPASYWELDAPIVIGEFPADTLAGRINPGFSVKRAYELAVYYGYAGIMSWSWSSTNDFNKDFSTTSRGLRAVSELIPNDLIIPNGQDIDRIPKVVKNVPPFRAIIEDISGDLVFLDLKSFFYDEEQGTDLNYELLELTNETGATPIIQNNSEVILEFNNPVPGTNHLSFRASDKIGWYADAKTIVMLGSYEGNEQNLAYFKPIYTATEATEKFSIYANDGNLATVWESTSNFNDTLVIDLEANLLQNFYALHWDNLSVSSYEFQISDDSLNWETVFDENYELISKVVFTRNNPYSGRYLRLIMSNSDQNRNFKVKEIVAEYVEENQSPEVIKSIDDLNYKLSDVKNINNYIKFEGIFTDAEHRKYLTYQIENSNSNLVRPEFSIGGMGLSLIFEKEQTGSSLITLTAIDPFGASVSTSFNVNVEQDILGIPEVENSVLVYPNPVSDKLIMDMRNQLIIPYQIVVYNSEGQLMDSFQNNKAIKTIDIGHYAGGIYVIQFLSENERFYKRFIKR
ncbi:T9SS type A sorting domain-containing protein [Marinigracilibium pacificum]|uniref:T9SS type A sorting domain-containing protein n=1 Tax=Marinigracilibium pacificum TaxID=2729599 RepID=A0A848J480_9BACT|nr:T9SS type A sorting domain-containing protein [Marinigracilibium pacificum]NMM49284.1 T9SS type A sorting domain-containing protein [Marinigracilibium pacificum]